MRYLNAVKEQVIKIYEVIKEFDQMPMRNFSGEFYDKETKKPPAPRKNKGKVEDLRPPRKN